MAKNEGSVSPEDSSVSLARVQMMHGVGKIGDEVEVAAPVLSCTGHCAVLYLTCVVTELLR